MGVKKRKVHSPPAPQPEVVSLVSDSENEYSAAVSVGMTEKPVTVWIPKKNTFVTTPFGIALVNDFRPRASSIPVDLTKTAA